MEKLRTEHDRAAVKGEGMKRPSEQDLIDALKAAGHDRAAEVVAQDAQKEADVSAGGQVEPPTGQEGEVFPPPHEAESHLTGGEQLEEATPAQAIHSILRAHLPGQTNEVKEDR